MPQRWIQHQIGAAPHNVLTLGAMDYREGQLGAQLPRSYIERLDQRPKTRNSQRQRTFGEFGDHFHDGVLLTAIVALRRFSRPKVNEPERWAALKLCQQDFSSRSSPSEARTAIIRLTSSRRSGEVL
jgi:hypothetical protein